MKDLETRMHDLGEFIREQRGMARLSLRKLSDMAGISNPYLSQIERGLRKPSAEILQQIAKALRISAETLYIRAGILEEREGESDLVDAILRDSTITEAQKQSMIAVYQAFRHENETARPYYYGVKFEPAMDEPAAAADEARPGVGETPTK